MSHLILLVEDNLDNRTIYRTILEHVGFRVVEAVDGHEALRAARETDPDLILMDISIPGIDGWEVTRMLKADDALRPVPIIALTAHAMRDDQDRAERIGFDAYLTKPIQPRQVVEAVQRFLVGRPPADGSEA